MVKQFIKTNVELLNWLYPRRSILAVDTETSSLDYFEMELVGISFCDGVNACYVDLIDNPEYDKMLKTLQVYFNGFDGTLIMHNASFDLEVFHKFELPCKAKIWDTLIASHLLDENTPNGLKYLATAFLDVPHQNIKEWEDVCGNPHSQEFYDYAITDSIWTWQLYELFAPRIEKEGLHHVFYDIEMPFVFCLRDMEINGVLLDVNKLVELQVKLIKQVEALQITLCELAEIDYFYQYKLDNTKELICEFNFNSPQQLSKLLQEKFTLNLGRPSESGYCSVDSKALNRHKTNEFVKTLIEYRQAITFLNKFVGKLPGFIKPDGRIHTSFRNTLVTGRLCIDPNTLIEMPRDLYRCPNGIPLKNIKVGDWVYSFDANRELCLRKVKWVGPTEIKPTITIYTDRGEPLTISPDHLIRKYRGEWVYAKTLKVGDRLLCMPSRSFTEGYSHFYPHSRNRGDGQQGGGVVHEHRFVYAQTHNMTNRLGKTIIHHKDGNKLNNVPDNIEQIPSFSAHMLLHSWSRNLTNVKHAIETGIGKYGKPLAQRTIDTYKTLLKKRLRQNHQIIKIEYGQPKQLWDIEIEDTHCVIGNDIALHNSSSDPPMQQLPKDNTGPVKIRECIVSPKGKSLICCDYSGQELRVLAEESGDMMLVDAFYKNQDVHLTVANKFFNLGIPDEVLIVGHPLHEETRKKYKIERDKIKPVNFGIVYGKTAYGFAKDWNISQDEAQKFIDDYFLTVPGVKVWIENVKNELRQNGYVTTLTGRRRRFPGYNSANNYTRSRMERQAGNDKIQSPSADMIKYAMDFIRVELQNHPEWDAKFILQIHDEFIIEARDEYVDDIKNAIRKIVSTKIPWQSVIPYIADVGSGKNYSQSKP